MRKIVAAWGWWVAGACTVLLGMYVVSRRLHFPAADEPDEQG